jgi:TPR repeat protein
MYHDGLGVTRNYTEAARWFQRAAYGGLAVSQEALGLMYTRGLGVPQDFVLAHMWLNLAAASYSPEFEKSEQERAIGRRNDVARSMTRQQVAEAQRLAREWQPK